MTDDYDRLAAEAGAVPARWATGDPSASVPLPIELRGPHWYRMRLTKAAKNLYALLRTVVDRSTLEEVSRLPSRPEPRHLAAIEHLLHGLASIASNPVVKANDRAYRRDYLAIPLDHNAFATKGRYSALSGAAFRAVVAALSECQEGGAGERWVEVVPARVDLATGERNRTRIRPNRHFRDWLVRERLIFAWHPHGQQFRSSKASRSNLWIREEVGSSSSVSSRKSPADLVKPLARPLVGDEQVLPPLNEALAQQRLSLNLENYHQYERLFDFKNGRPRISGQNRKRLYRQFVGSDGRGGRLHGPWVQQVPSSLRSLISMNGQPTIEVDYRAMQLALLYALSELPAPVLADPYEIPGGRHSRDDMKLVLTRSVGCASRGEAINSIRYELERGGRATPGRAKSLYDDFWAFHEKANPHRAYREAVWPRLQYLDSQIALRVLKKLFDEGILAIPIHDSFIVQTRFREQLRRAMTASFEEICPTTTVELR